MSGASHFGRGCEALTQLKGIARTQWGRLIGDYVGVVAGNRQQLLGKTQATDSSDREDSQVVTASYLSFMTS